MEELASLLDGLATQSRRPEDVSLEGLAELLCCLLHLAPVKWLVRNSDSGGKDDHPLQRRWLIQCVDSEHISVDIVATGVGRGFPFAGLRTTAFPVKLMYGKMAHVQCRALHDPRAAKM